MRNLTTIAVLGTLALAACNKPAETPEAAATTEAAAPAAEASAPAAPITPIPGEYAVSDKDGKALSTVTLNADNTYRQQPAKGLAVAGIMKMVDGKTCFDPSGAAEAVCYVDSPRAADGSFTATMDDGTVLTVKPATK